MNHLRIATFSALVVAVSNGAWAQQTTPPPQAATATSAAIGALDTTPAVAPTDAVDPAPAAADAAKEPRIILGNDQVIAPPKAGIRPISGAPSSFKFEEAPIAEVANVILGEIAKTDFVFHGQVNGTVTLATREPVTPDQAVFLLETALQANGLVMARDARGTYHIGKPEALKGIVAAPRQAVGGALPPGFGAVIVPLRYIGAGEMAAILRPIAGGDALVRVDTVRNLLVMVGTRAQAEGWLDIVSTFDVDLLKGMSVGVFPLKYATVAEVQAALQIVSGGGQPTTGASPSRPGGPATATASTPAASSQAAGAAALAEANPLFGALRIMPIERINSILVVTPRAAYLEEARRWIERLDKPSSNGSEPQLHVYSVQNGNARHLAEVLSGIYGGSSGNASGGTGIAPGLGSSSGISNGLSNNSFGGSGGFGSGGFGGSGSSGGVGIVSGGGFGGTFGASGGSGAFGGNNSNNSNSNQQAGRGGGVSAVTIGNGVRVIADDVNNAVLIYASNSEFLKIEATLKRLDVRVPQVLIEASIIEVTLKGNLQYGLEWSFQNGGRGLTGIGQLSNANNTVAGSLAEAASGFSYAITNSSGAVRAALNALASDSLVKVISSPSLMVMDNQVASIMVGDQVPIQTGTTIVTGVGTTNSFQYKDTGVQLQVLPSVNAGNIVTMQLSQAVTDVGTIRDQATGQYPFRQRQITSKVAVRSGEALVLGGLIRDNTGNGNNGIPFLKDLPIVGAAFGSTTVSKDRTELIVILTPRVVRADEDIRDVGAEMRDRMKGIFSDDRLSNQGRAPVGAWGSVVDQSPGASKLPNPATYIKTPN
ncbi:type II secretion system secretin GspD [Xylophilus sp. GW821-FHT01B05]